MIISNNINDNDCKKCSNNDIIDHHNDYRKGSRLFFKKVFD